MRNFAPFYFILNCYRVNRMNNLLSVVIKFEYFNTKSMNVLLCSKWQSEGGWQKHMTMFAAIAVKPIEGVN